MPFNMEMENVMPAFVTMRSLDEVVFHHRHKQKRILQAAAQHCRLGLLQSRVDSRTARLRSGEAAVWTARVGPDQRRRIAAQSRPPAVAVGHRQLNPGSRRWRSLTLGGSVQCSALSTAVVQNKSGYDRQQRCCTDCWLPAKSFNIKCRLRGSATPMKMGGRGPCGSEARIFFRG